MIIVEERTHGGLVATARERLVNKASHTDEEQCGTVVAPCSHDMKCPMFRSDTKTLECTFNQAYLRCKEGPKLREGTGAGSVIARRQTAEDYAYVCVQKAPRTTFRSARVVGTPLKRDGHVHVDMCMPTAQIQRLMFQRAHMKQDFQEFEGAQMFKDARKAAHGARMIYEYAIPKDFDAADAADQDPLNPRLKSLAEFGEEGSTQRALYQKSLEPTEPMHLITANAGKIMPDSSLKTYQRVQPTVQIFHQGDRTIAHNQQRALAQGDRQSREARGDAFFADRPEVDAMFEPTHTPGGRRL
ncbi:mitochondrial small ribosomal subunit Rsm22-domain-containing protein [Pelagophyceae sp. CCMP2097]|nr:mitochondrial small ribosomal subunit Rsm22-domain-containing protein [Pelagophyceae sp. CCMP2097]